MTAAIVLLVVILALTVSLIVLSLWADKIRALEYELAARDYTINVAEDALANGKNKAAEVREKLESLKLAHYKLTDKHKAATRRIGELMVDLSQAMKGGS